MMTDKIIIYIINVCASGDELYEFAVHPDAYGQQRGKLDEQVARACPLDGDEPPS